MSRLVFLRHAHSNANHEGILSGRLPGVSLSVKGFEQSSSLVNRLSRATFDQIRISPLERCHQTITPWLNSPYGNGALQLFIDDDLNEVDYGSWSGKKLSTLRKQQLWKDVQSRPHEVRFPDGERMQNVYKRVARSILAAHSSKKSGTFLFISHGDIIKTALAYAVGLPLRNFQNFVINPASLSVVDFDGSAGRLLCYNDNSSEILDYLKGEKVSRTLVGGGAGFVRKLRK